MRLLIRAAHIEDDDWLIFVRVGDVGMFAAPGVEGAVILNEVLRENSFSHPAFVIHDEANGAVTLEKEIVDFGDLPWFKRRKLAKGADLLAPDFFGP